VNADSSDDITRASKLLKDVIQKKSELQASLIRGMRRKDTLEQQIRCFQGKDMK